MNAVRPTHRRSIKSDENVVEKYKPVRRRRFPFGVKHVSCLKCEIKAGNAASGVRLYHETKGTRWRTTELKERGCASSMRALVTKVYVLRT